MKTCIFCEIVQGKMPCHMVWEDDTHLAFLSIFPNTPGVTVVIPKKHVSSYIFDAEEKIMLDLMKAGKKVAKCLDKAFSDVGRTGVVFEGFGVDHLHMKLYPLHGTDSMETWKPRENSRDEFYDAYPGFISSHDAARIDDEDLEMLAKSIRKAREK